MSLPVVLRPESRAEFDAAFNWYEGQRPGLGVEFVTCMQETFYAITRAPELRAKVYQDVCRAPVRRFPYSVFYKLETDHVLVVAVFHGKRDPKVWQARA